MENKANVRSESILQALDLVIGEIERGLEIAFGPEGVIGGEGQSLAEFAREYPKGEGAARDFSLLAALDELRDDWTDGMRTKHGDALREQEYPQAARRGEIDVTS